MGFQIIGKNGEIIPLNVVDEEVCNFWGGKPHQKWWASPIKQKEKPESFESEADEEIWDAKHISYKMTNNWYDTLGWLIHSGADTWDKLRESYISAYRELVESHVGEKTYEITKETILGEGSTTKQFMNLIDFWEKQGYTPKMCIDY